MKVCSVDLSREGDVMIGGWLYVMSVGGSIKLKIQRQFESRGHGRTHSQQPNLTNITTAQL